MSKFKSKEKNDFVKTDEEYLDTSGETELEKTEQEIEDEKYRKERKKFLIIGEFFIFSFLVIFLVIVIIVFAVVSVLY